MGNAARPMAARCRACESSKEVTSSKRAPNERLEELDTVLNALAHPARRHILLVVWFRGGEMSAGEIAGRFGCTWPTTSRHLRLLVTAGLLKVEKQGRTRFYRVNKSKFGPVQE